jgi:hypothetical protein
MATSGEGPGEPTSSKNRALNLGASVSQSFAPLSNICAHLHAYHIYASEPTRCVEANHYCSQINEGTPKDKSLVLFWSGTLCRY